MGNKEPIGESTLLVRWDLGHESGSRHAGDTPDLVPVNRVAHRYALQIRAEGLDALGGFYKNTAPDMAFGALGSGAGVADEADPISH